ncbi:MAG: YrhK family protein [Chloroflexaceae bacterium]
MHTIIGIIGNVCFFVGSIFFLFDTLQTAGTWLFIFGSLGMLISSVGSAIVMAHRDPSVPTPDATSAGRTPGIPAATAVSLIRPSPLQSCADVQPEDPTVETVCSPLSRQGNAGISLAGSFPLRQT